MRAATVTLSLRVVKNNKFIRGQSARTKG